MSILIKKDNTVYISSIHKGIPKLQVQKNNQEYFYFYNEFLNGLIDNPRIDVDSKNDIPNILKTFGYNVKPISDLSNYLPNNLKIIDEISYNKFICDDGTIIENEYFDTHKGYSIGISNTFISYHDANELYIYEKNMKNKKYSNLPYYLREKGLPLTKNILNQYTLNNLKSTLLSKIKYNNTIITVMEYQTTLPNLKKKYRDIYSWLNQLGIKAEMRSKNDNDNNHMYQLYQNIPKKKNIRRSQSIITLSKKQLIWLFDNDINPYLKININDETYNVIDIYKWYHKPKLIFYKKLSSKSLRYKDKKSKYKVTLGYPIEPWLKASNNKYLLTNLLKRQLNLFFEKLNLDYNLPKFKYNIPNTFNKIKDNIYYDSKSKIKLNINDLIQNTKKNNQTSSILAIRYDSILLKNGNKVKINEFKTWTFSKLIKNINEYQEKYAIVVNNLFNIKLNKTLNTQQIEYIKNKYKKYIHIEN